MQPIEPEKSAYQIKHTGLAAVLYQRLGFDDAIV